MANSRRFQKLRTELTRLRKHFLPKTWNPTGSYSQRGIDYSRAYRILAHAEIEAFIENILLDVVEKKYSEWVKQKKATFVITCLLAASKFGWQDSEIDISPISPLKIRRDDESINQLIERIVEQYRQIVKDNNGIMDKDLKRLLMPAGISLSDLDQTWLNDMNSFGGQRGFFAHSSRLGITNLPDPKTEFDNIQKLLPGLDLLDKKVLEIGKSKQ